MSKEQEDDQVQRTAGEGGASSDVGAAVAVTAPRRSAWTFVIGALCLAAGWGMGQLGHDRQVREAHDEADAAVQGKGEGREAAGLCETWADTICSQMGRAAYECKSALRARTLLSGSACVLALESAPARIDALRAERVVCTDLSRKLCNDLGPDAEGCKLVMAKEPRIAPTDCEDMMERYQETLAQIMSRQARGTLPEAPVTTKLN